MRAASTTDNDIIIMHKAMINPFHSYDYNDTSTNIYVYMDIRL